MLWKRASERASFAFDGRFYLTFLSINRGMGGRRVGDFCGAEFLNIQSLAQELSVWHLYMGEDAVAFKGMLVQVG